MNKRVQNCIPIVGRFVFLICRVRTYRRPLLRKTQISEFPVQTGTIPGHVRVVDNSTIIAKLQCKIKNRAVNSIGCYRKHGRRIDSDNLSNRFRIRINVPEPCYDRIIFLKFFFKFVPF